MVFGRISEDGSGARRALPWPPLRNFSMLSENTLPHAPWDSQAATRRPRADQSRPHPKTGPQKKFTFPTLFPLTHFGCLCYKSLLFRGAVAQLGERMTGSHEVRGSIPLSSTKENKRDSAS